MSQRGERQKDVTNGYRAGWDRIWTLRESNPDADRVFCSCCGGRGPREDCVLCAMNDGTSKGARKVQGGFAGSYGGMVSEPGAPKS